MKQQYEDFDEFIAWLKKDGLKPLKSERIWKKKIFTNLLNGHVKTLENYNDFLKDQKLRALIAKKTSYKGFNKAIRSVNVTHEFCVLTLEDRSVLKVRTNDLDEFIENYISWTQNG